VEISEEADEVHPLSRQALPLKTKKLEMIDAGK
jgi:hypothetical protein